MKLEGIKLSINIDTLMKLFSKKKQRVQVGELIEVKGFKYRVYDVDNESFKAFMEKE